MYRCAAHSAIFMEFGVLCVCVYVCWERERGGGGRRVEGGAGGSEGAEDGEHHSRWP